MDARVCESFAFCSCICIFYIVTFTLCIDPLESLDRTELLKALTVGSCRLRCLLDLVSCVTY